MHPGFSMIQVPTAWPAASVATFSDNPPARVRLALEFLSHLTFKTMTRPAINDMSIEEIHGQELTLEEACAQATACSLLNSYFLGKLKPDFWEKERSSRGHHQGIPTSRPGTMLRCPGCHPGPPRPNCSLCDGEGQVIIFPTAAGQGGEE